MLVLGRDDCSVAANYLGVNRKFVTEIPAVLHLHLADRRLEIGAQAGGVEGLFQNKIGPQFCCGGDGRLSTHNGEDHRFTI